MPGSAPPFAPPASPSSTTSGRLSITRLAFADRAFDAAAFLNTDGGGDADQRLDAVGEVFLHFGLLFGTEVRELRLQLHQHRQFV